jgi:hypothetical protein
MQADIRVHEDELVKEFVERGRYALVADDAALRFTSDYQRCWFHQVPMDHARRASRAR